MENRQENLFPPSLPNQQLLFFDEELWLMAEERAQEILCTIQPNVISEVTRKEIIEYVRRLIRGYYGAEVFPFGSVPLKTYLPDGDIDLTALSHEKDEEDLANMVCSMLQSKGNSEFQVTDIQHIHAKVQVVKCTVKNIAVDISFNQMAGLCAMHFLEQVDKLAGKNHLLKRSIILIKAWCYYESRILGAHHGLLSTYAVEILVLYIINLYHSSLRGPLEVLYKFLDYYSAFDWESNYVTIDGSKPLSSLPEIIETPECEWGGFLLDKEFLKNYRDMCSILAKESETKTHEFPTKYMNILDPLRNDNNLGRSVSRGNLHRIRFALSFGARKLKEILALPGEKMGSALERFFMNTLDRNGKGQRPDVEVPVHAFGTGRCEEPVLYGDCENYYDALQYLQLYCSSPRPLSALPSSQSATQADIHAVSTQQNWNLYYQSGATVYVPIQTDVYAPTCPDVYVPIQNDVYVPIQTDVYAPAHTFYRQNVPHATFGLEEIRKSRGTGTYIPDVTRNSYWDMRVKENKPRRHAPVNHHNVLPKSPPKKPPPEEVHSKETHSNSNIVKVANEEFAIPSGMSHNVLPKAPQKKQPPEEVHSNETPGANGNSRPFELAKEEFPLLSSIHQKSTPEVQESIHFTISEQAKNSSLCQLDIKFGSYRKSEPSLPTMDKKADSSAWSSESTMIVVPGMAKQRNKECSESDVKRGE
ncbi:hypothetical protein HN51_032104 [Arachis hypogaea]|uniref:uncharacterized protein n=1 Tax=Arachis hypogaea TaxID=3818 RepID=UPI000DEC066E|nr:uncharacterized protein LOC112715806 [Arachis hypogaea]XP_029145516.1 uncharacterized protein LOC112715806 [Arachis hypogaea]